MANKMKSVGPDPNSPYDQGLYIPQNPSKYKSLEKKIIYRSSLERKFCEFCDLSPKVIGWASEAFSIPYLHPFKKDNNGKNITNNYYPDYYMEIQLNDGTIDHYVVEVKPISMIVRPPLLRKNASQSQKSSYNYKLKAIIINRTKANAAEQWCKKRGWKFTFITEQFFIR